MKLFLATLLLSTAAFASQVVEPGIYSAVDIETKTIVASLDIRADNTVNFKVKTPDFTMPEPGCEGTWSVEGNTLSSDLQCPLDFLSQVSVQIDITNVTPEAVRSAEGVNVAVVIDALGADAFEFNLKKVK